MDKGQDFQLLLDNYYLKAKKLIQKKKKILVIFDLLEGFVWKQYQNSNLPVMSLKNQYDQIPKEIFSPLPLAYLKQVFLKTKSYIF